MANETKDKDRQQNNEDAPVKPDPETLHTTDPQEHMKGPVSSLVHKVEKLVEGNTDQDESHKEKKE